ncbi:hypothetical protein KJ656_11790, partial [bacterium]|nr:hypothetical protein [bacterium]
MLKARLIRSMILTFALLLLSGLYAQAPDTLWTRTLGRSGYDWSLKMVSEDIAGIVAYYPFNGNANDESGNDNHGTVNSATLTTDRFGNENSAYYFDGEDDYIRIQHSPELSSANQSISLFFRSSSF